ncbi:MAG: FliH/SctL family protein [Acidobacteriaceae bacterium]|nr:FliH/SctL family protein [Acidobacteriaceae bacterium]
MTTPFDSPSESEVIALQFEEWSESVGPSFVDAQELANAAAERDVLTSEFQQELAVRVEEAREAARHEAHEAGEQRIHDAIEIERTAVAMACAGFAKARERYFNEIELEVVKLSLSIAERVLHREVMMDATLLAGVVRVALAKLSSADGVVLFVPADDAEEWRKAMKLTELQVQGDDLLRRGDVRLQTTAGVAELGLKPQLAEIERGFFDLLSKRHA